MFILSNSISLLRCDELLKGKEKLVEKNCIIVYSNKKHVPYIENILWHLHNILEEKGYNPILLGELINSGENYTDTIKEIIRKSVLGVVILDGFRPNVILEFGMILILEKPIIVILTNKAQISIKGFYKSAFDSGLTKRKFIDLKEPIIDINEHLSDWAGNHYLFLDYNDPESLREEFDKQLDKMKEELDNSEREVKIYEEEFAQNILNNIVLNSEQSKEIEFPMEVLHEIKSHKLDFKEDFPQSADNIGKLISAYSNNEGGVIYFGIDDNRKLIGLENEQKIEERISGILRNFSKPPDITYEVFRLSIGKKILKVIINKSPKLIQYKDSFYFRDKNSSLTRKLQFEEIESRFLMSNNLSNATANILASVIEEDQETEKFILFGEFILKYNQLVIALTNKYNIDENPRRFYQIIGLINSDMSIPEHIKHLFKEVKGFRNKIVHTTQETDIDEFRKYFSILEELLTIFSDFKKNKKN